MTGDVITIVQTYPDNPKEVKVAINYGCNKPRAEEQFNGAHYCLRTKFPMRIDAGRRHYDIIVTDGHLEKDEAFDATITYILHLKGEIVNEQ